MSKGNNPSRATLDMRQREAKERQEAYDKLTLTQKLEMLDRKFPNGAKKQRARLLGDRARSLGLLKAEPTVGEERDALEATSKGKKNSGYEKRSGEERKGSK